MDAIYESVAGIAWRETEEKFLLPSAFAGRTSYTIVVDPPPADAVSAADKRDFIWVIFGGNGQPNEVWRGRLNRLGFEREERPGLLKRLFRTDSGEGEASA